jgi:hypothetical protein
MILYVCTETEKIRTQNVEMRYDAIGAKFTITWSRVKPTQHEEMSRLFMRSHLANPGLERGAPGWRGVKSWPGYRVNANRDLFVDGLTRAGKPTRVDSQPGLV